MNKILCFTIITLFVSIVYRFSIKEKCIYLNFEDSKIEFHDIKDSTSANLEATFIFHKDTNGIVSAPEHMDSEIVVLYRINDFTL